MNEQKSKNRYKLLYHYFFDFLVVFAGVFLAFWLSEYQERKRQAAKRQEIYTAVYEELNDFVEDGKKENSESFVNFFRNIDKQSDSLIALRQLPVKMNIYGDYWKIPIVNSLVANGALQDIDIETFKNVTRFNTVHNNFLANIKDYNEFYDKYVTAEYDQGMDNFFKDGTNELKPKYTYLENAVEEIASFAELLVDFAQVLSKDIKEEHIED